MTLLNKAVHRVTNTELDGAFGTDKHRKLVASLVPGSSGRPDVLLLRPHGTRRPETIRLIDVYHYAIRARSNRETLEKARLRKERLKEQRAAQAVARADARLRREARARRDQ